MNFNRLAPLYDSFHRGAQRTAGMIVTSLGLNKNTSVLDLGGGTGRIAGLLIDYVREVTVLDSSSGMIEQCKRKNKKGVHCLVGDATSLPFAPESFDLVIMVDAFHHFQDKEKVMIEVRQVLRPQGKVLLEEFHPRRLKGFLVMLLERFFHTGSVFFEPEQLARYWQKAGFQVEIKNGNKGVYFL